MKLCIDLDGTICHVKKDDESYWDVQPLPGAVDAIQRLHAAGHYIIIYSARHMGTQQANEGKVAAMRGYLYAWLDKWEIPYHEIYIKPLADIYIDDRAYRHTDWESTVEFLNTL